MAIPEAAQHLMTLFGDRHIHITTSEHGMTVAVDNTDISKFELEGQLAILSQYGVYPNGHWYEEMFFTDTPPVKK